MAKSDKVFKEVMLNALFNGSSFREVYKDDRTSCIRCWDILQNDEKFRKEYNKVLDMQIAGKEEELASGALFKDLPTCVDKLGNIDLAPNYVRVAELKAKQAYWLLEKRVSEYSKKIDVNASGSPLGVMILPNKLPKEIPVDTTNTDTNDIG